MSWPRISSHTTLLSPAVDPTAICDEAHDVQQKYPCIQPSVGPDPKLNATSLRKALLSTSCRQDDMFGISGGATLAHVRPPGQATQRSTLTIERAFF